MVARPNGCLHPLQRLCFGRYGREGGRAKARAFDRILAAYRSLQDEAGFYSRNWVELSEVIDREAKNLEQLLTEGSSSPW